MKKWLTILLVCSIAKSSIAQIIVDHAFHKSGNFLYYFSDTANRAHLKYYTVFSCPDSTGKDSAYIVNNALGKEIRTNSNNWNLGKQPLCTNGDTAVFNVVFYIIGPDKKDSLESAVQFVMNNMPTRIFDTANRLNNILTAIGNSSVTQLAYIMNTFSSEKFYKNFAKFRPVDFSSNSITSTYANWVAIKQPFYSNWISGDAGGFPYNFGYTNDAYDSALVHNSSPNQTKLTVMGGQSYSSITHDSAYYKNGLDADDNIWMWFTDVYQCIDTAATLLPRDTANQYDFTGCGRCGVTSRYFDSKANPLKGNFINDSTTGNTVISGDDCYTRVTNYRRNRILNLHFNDSVMLEYCYYCTSPNCSGVDTVYGYQKNDSCESLTFYENMTLSTTPSWQIISSGGNYGWHKLILPHDTTQEVTIQLRKNNNCETNITGFIFYGRKVANGNPRYNFDSTVWASADANHATIRDLTGVTAYNLYQQHDLDSITSIRNGLEQIFMFDTTKLVQQPQEDISSRDYYDSTLNTFMAGRYIYINMQGPDSKVFHDAGDDFNQRPVNNLGDDRRLHQNYSHYSQNAYSLAALFGNNPSVNMSFASIKNWNGQKAKNIYKGLEPTNESLGAFFSPNYVQDPIGEAAMVGMVIDNFGGAYGPYGAKNADPNFKIILPATIGWDIHSQRATLRLLQFGYHSTHPPIDMIAFHTYPSAIKAPVGLNTNALIGDFSTTPSDQGYYQDYKNYLHLIFGMWHGYIPITSNEYGADKQYARTTTANGQFDTSLYGCPHYTGFTQPQSLGISLVSQLCQFSTLPMAQANVFTFKDDLSPAQNFVAPPYSIAGMLYYYLHPITFALDSTKYWDNYFYYKGFTQNLFPYKYEKVIDSAAKGLWIIKYRDTTNATRVKYVVFNDDTVSATVPFSLTVGLVSGATVSTANFNSISMSTNGASIVSGILSGNASAKQQVFSMTEISVAQKSIKRKPGTKIKLK